MSSPHTEELVNQLFKLRGLTCHTKSNTILIRDCKTLGFYSLNTKYSLPKSHSSTSWDLNSEKNMNCSQWRGTNYFLIPIWFLPWIAQVMVGNLKDHFSCKESQILSSSSKIKQRFMWDRSVNYISRLGQYTSSSSGHVESCSYSKGELVGSVSQRKEKVIMWVTRPVFIITYFQNPIHQSFDDKHRLSSH